MAQDLSALPRSLYTGQQIRAAETEAVARGDVTLYGLVERAGEAAFSLITQQHSAPTEVLVLAGTGNNGADALVCAARLLKAGYAVTLMALPKAEPGEPLSLALAAFAAQGGKVQPMALPEIAKAKLIVDGLLGTGVTGALRPGLADIIAAVNGANAWVLSLDLPSGLNADTGACGGVPVQADVTLTFGGLKQGLFTAKGRQHSGFIALAELGLAAYLPQPAALKVTLEYLASCLAPRARDSHKGMAGKVLIVGGDTGMAGAIRLAGEACLRAGAGLVTVMSRPEHQVTVNMNRPELMFLGCEPADQAFLQRLEWAQLVLLGPGLGQQAWGRACFDACLGAGRAGIPRLLDADALNLLSQAPRSCPDWVLTPHPGEAARLLGCSLAEVETDRFAAIRAIQRKYEGVVLLKGAGTLIFDGEHMYVAPVGNPGLASGGCGDVLSGIIAALMAQGLEPISATLAGVIVQGYAADLAAAEGERGMLASDLMPFIRQLVNSDLL
ncbi:NAD(P)H-hydrate dehydratase [Shewanella sp. AS16]|uniref:NAD(P)H-hydrate dehydratase n=1 Tax=Shewanella sp. AS16 TaxID=2907625 RepID=UPI001F2984B5|nr:NAD(P)H-hydrate dehydratase [Shewanella sp. AS16]MCE9687032.1 NAD(P)H-hydrate dehydratase [Shewanella sp. AS16]